MGPDRVCRQRARTGTTRAAVGALPVSRPAARRRDRFPARSHPGLAACRPRAQRQAPRAAAAARRAATAPSRCRRTTACVADRRQQRRQCPQAVSRRHGLDAVLGEVALQLRPGEEAELSPWPPVDAQRRPAFGTAMPRQRVQEGVRCRVVRRPGRAQQGRGRRKEHEEVQFRVSGQRVQVPGALNLGRHDLAEFRARRGVAGWRRRRSRPHAPPHAAVASTRRSIRGRPQHRRLWRRRPARRSPRCRPLAARPAVSCADAEAPPRPIRTRCRAPCSAIHVATTSPSAPSPPVTR